MSATEQNYGILDVIHTLASNGESGRLSMNTGTTDGVFYFSNGQLVDARVGNLTGFQAINAAASMPQAIFSFDPAVAPPPFSSIRPNERVVLKQFFGIDTVAPEESSHVEELMPDDEATLVRPNVAPAEVESAIPYETTSSANVPPAEVQSDIPYQPSSRPTYQSGLLVAAVVFLLAAAAVVLLYKFGDYDPPEYHPSTTVATSNEPPPAVAEQPSSPAPAAAQPSSVPVAEQVEPNREPTSPAQDLTGKWNVVNTVQKTSYGSFNNLQIGFNLSIQQSGKGFTGRGEKVSENGRSLPPGSRTPIQVQGSINGDRVEATFYEQGTTRKTNGRFVWRVDKAGGLTGTFNSTAARTSGKSTARKV
jgi:Domain of unknown function (DUF4388)